MRFTGKDTFSGREMRQYLCDACGHDDSEDTGPALWTFLSQTKEPPEK